MDNGLEKSSRYIFGRRIRTKIKKWKKTYNKIRSRPIKTRFTFRSYSCIKSIKDISRNGT